MPLMVADVVNGELQEWSADDRHDTLAEWMKAFKAFGGLVPHFEFNQPGVLVFKLPGRKGGEPDKFYAVQVPVEPTESKQLSVPEWTQQHVQ